MCTNPDAPTGRTGRSRDTGARRGRTAQGGLGEATAPPNGNLGGAISPTLTPFLAQSMGWEGALYTTAALAGCGAFFWLWVHPEHEIDLEGVPSKQLPVTQTIGVEAAE